jgi:leucyl aminopeptidase (aminopeptidase T)
VSASPVSPATRSRVARSVLRKNLAVKPGERVVVEAWTHTLPWAVAFAREARRLGALPLVPFEDEAGYWEAVDDGEFKVLGRAAAHEWAALGATNVYLHMWGPGDRVRLNKLGPKRMGALFGFNSAWYAAARKSGLRGARLELGRPYPELARAYGADVGTWTDQLVRAMMVEPSTLARAAAPLEQALARGRRLRIRNADGTDLTLGLAHRRVVSMLGRPVVGDPKRPFDMLTSLPSGSLRVSLDESVADGTIVANRTCFYDDGKATGAVLRFRHGKLTDAEFDKGGERFDAGFRTGGKGRDRPGFLGIGLNPELHDTPQVEDIERGAVMVSVGGNRLWGGKNASPFFGWAINAGASLEVDGRSVLSRA